MSKPKYNSLTILCDHQHITNYNTMHYRRQIVLLNFTNIFTSKTVEAKHRFFLGAPLIPYYYPHVPIWSGDVSPARNGWLSNKVYSSLVQLTFCHGSEMKLTSAPMLQI